MKSIRHRSLLSVFYTAIIALFSFYTGSAQGDRRLVQTDITAPGCLADWWKEMGARDGIYSLKPLPVEGWWVVVAPAGRSAALTSLPCVKLVTEDRKLSLRRSPNDPAYINQKDMNLIGMPKAWDITTGGLTAHGDTIVVAVIDAGYQVDHEDLAGNIWFNRGEIPGDGIDNDDNGYIDDYRGLNVGLGNDAHPVHTHGTSVCGVIGARGNNGQGVAGVNWQVKMMLISGAGYESEVIESYQYALDMRKKYRQSLGAQGAFVVAVNLSSGIDMAHAEDHPLWCGMYDKLGQEGILGVCAAPNRGISVDEDGDMPTTCTSEYLVAVTNVDITDQLSLNAGFGPVSIDIGAPGHGTITVASGNQYKEFSGTSSATPHVTGVIALMYSTPCTSFLATVWTDPGAIAARVRNMVLTSATSNSSLQGITTTGGRLQADAALRAVEEECGAGPSPGNVHIVSLHPNPVSGTWADAYFEIAGDTASAFFELYTATGVQVARIPLTESEFTQGYVRLDVQSLPAGIYMLTLHNRKERTTRKLFVY